MKIMNFVLATVIMTMANDGRAEQKKEISANGDEQVKASAEIFDGAKNGNGSLADAVQIPDSGNSRASDAKEDLSQPPAGSGGLESIKQYMNSRSVFYRNRAKEERKKTVVGAAVIATAAVAWNVANHLMTSLLPLIGYAFGALGFGLMGYLIYKTAKNWKGAKKSAKVLNVVKIGLMAAAGAAALLTPVTLGLMGLIASGILGLGYAIKHDRVADDAANRSKVLREEASIAGT